MPAGASVVDDIKDRISMVDLVGREIALRREGNHHKADCPFHAEKSASFHVYDDHYHCFGCGAHGDVFTWVQARAGVEFVEALRALAKETGVTLRDDPEVAKARAAHLTRVEALKAIAAFYHSRLGDAPSVVGYLKGRGFTTEFIASYQIGWAPGKCVLKSGVAESQLVELGLYNAQTGLDFFWHRIVFPVWGRSSAEIVDLAGRIYEDGEPKYLKLPGPTTLLNERGIRNQKLAYLAEGDTDTATLVQAGLPVVGTRGVTSLKGDQVDAFAKAETIYVCADADEAGLKLVHRAGELFGVRARVVNLPAGEDLNSYVGQKGQTLESLAAAAPAYPDWLIERLPTAGVAPDQVEATVKEFAPVLLGMGKSAQDAYTKRLARAMGITVAPIREELRAIKGRIAANGNGNGHGPSLQGTHIIWQDRPIVNPSQALVDDAMLTTAFLDAAITDEDGETKVETSPFVVTSRHETFALNDAEMLGRVLRFLPTKVPSFSILHQRWATGDGFPHSVKNYVDGGVSVSPWDVYSEVASYFQRYVDYPNPVFRDFLSLWTIGTYFFNLFAAFPYTHLVGTKRCGKTLTLEIIAELAFNAVFASSMTGAAAYRTVESCSATLLLDEAENLVKRDKDKSDSDQGDKLEILKSGYKRGGIAVRCSGENNEPTGYDVYSPKIFGSIGPIDRVLADRAITLTLARKHPDVHLDEFRPVEYAALAGRTRDKLYVLMLDYGKEISERMHDGLNWSGVTDRDRELWTPILTMAEFFDDYRLDLEGASAVPKEDLLLAKMRAMARENVQDRIARDRLEQVEVLIIEGTLDFLDGAKPLVDEWYSAKELFEYLTTRDELAWLKSMNRLYDELAKVQVIARAKDIARRRLAGTGLETKQTRCIHLNIDRVQKAARRLGAAIPSEK